MLSAFQAAILASRGFEFRGVRQDGPMFVAEATKDGHVLAHAGKTEGEAVHLMVKLAARPEGRASG